MDNLSVTMIILLAIPVMGLAIAGVIIYRYLHSSCTVELHSKVTPAGVSPEIQPSSIQSPNPSSLDVFSAQVADAVIPLTDLGVILARDQEATIPYEEKRELPPITVDKPNNVIEAIETTSQTSAPTPDLAFMPSLPPAITKRTPVDRGGRSRGSFQGEESEQPKTSQRKPRALKPEVVCWYEGRKWFVGLETPEEFQEYIGLTVTQDGIPLTLDDKERWALIKTSGKVSVSWDEVEQPFEIDLNNKPYLLFKLAERSIRRGRLIRYATVGSFLVIAPDEWHRDEEVSGLSRLSPEPVFVVGNQAHYFLLDRESDLRIAFLTPEGRTIRIPTNAALFELVGNQLQGANEDIGPLFGEGPPRIRALDKSVWSDIRTIVVGQEGIGEKRWRKDFNPVLDYIEQELPPELSEKVGGWYFIRFYDAEDSLVESMDFRFINLLKDIRISPHSVLPGSNGHLPTRVEFLHSKDCFIEMADSSTKIIFIEYEDGRTSATIPPDPIWDKTRWLIQPVDITQVEVEILVDRVWWAISEESAEGLLNKWADTPLNISRDLITATSKIALLFRLPHPRWAKEIRVGFEQWRARTYPVEVAKQEVNVPLSHFEGAKEIEDQAHESMLSLWIKDDNNQDVSVVVAIIPATKPISVDTGRARADVRCMRNYLKRLGRRSQDSALRQMISTMREKWSVSDPKYEADSYRIETSCVIALAWESSRANGIKPLGHRKRWLRKFVGLATSHPDTMQEIREQLETLKQDPINASLRPKR